ncbi:biotin carboxylase N-terminal domain-containing protein [Amphibiibacter pelophylacis]|uniref:Acetyl/propionyl/methylcrotonyl-CoA carboxylase subunit alpha n=1 Tax=Amphibiibacter pelophylacis TaxID=1799477 RepID=A0ACC6P2R7_9BURK
MFTKILIANRGEIACRVIATARKMGIATVAVYSQADRNARHVRLADEAVCVGPAAARESYLRADAILQAARDTGAQAIHPGYGFLSENAAFARDCEAAGITFIGPPASAIEAMGSKSASKALMQRAGVPLTPGYHGDDQDGALLQAEADAIGYPVLIKASAGGGGKGMRRVDARCDFAAALASCQREAASSFGDARVLVEKCLENPRHIEVQVFADTQGHAVHLYERDCSMQRRYQKVIEEAPAPGLTPGQRAAMGQAAVDAALAVGYVGAGTVEFIAQQQPGGELIFYFMEMNTRLQVEHPVTEMITGLDLVEWQLRIAAGEPLPLAQDAIPCQGHAFEVRIYAEDADHGFLPATGLLQHVQPPPASRQVRIDTGVESGDTITPHYDPMIAKLIVHGDSRSEALQRLLSALAQYQIVGVTHNLGFLQRLAGHPDFAAARLDTGLIARELERLVPPPAPVPDAVQALAALALHRLDAQTRAAPAPGSAWAHALAGGAEVNADTATGWRLNDAQAAIPVRLRRVAHASDGVQLDSLWRLQARPAQGTGDPAGTPCWRLMDAAGVAQDIEVQSRPGDSAATAGLIHWQILQDGQRWQATTLPDMQPGQAARVHVLVASGAQAGHWTLERILPGPDADAAQGGAGHVRAPMPGKVIALLVQAGDRVEAGQPLAVMEAMKMEHTLTAPHAGVVAALNCAVGDQVGDGVDLLDLEPAA